MGRRDGSISGDEGHVDPGCERNDNFRSKKAQLTMRGMQNQILITIQEAEALIHVAARDIIMRRMAIQEAKTCSHMRGRGEKSLDKQRGHSSHSEYRTTKAKHSHKKKSKKSKDRDRKRITKSPVVIPTEGMVLLVR